MVSGPPQSVDSKRPDLPADGAQLCRDPDVGCRSAYLPLTHDRVIFMVIGRKSRRDARTPRARELFGENAGAALDLLELLELAWHDCYAEVSPPDEVIEDVWIVSAVSYTHLTLPTNREV